MYTTTNIGLTVWNLLDDKFDHTQLSNNWVALDDHDHGNNGGVQIQTAGIANKAVTAAEIADGTLTGTQISDGSITYVELANNTKRMIWTNPGVNYSASAGNLVLGANGITVTLPVATGGNTNALIGVVAPNTIVSATPTIVSCASTIRGPGVGGTSFALGAPNSFAVLQSDGTIWRIIAGCVDTGFNAITMGTNIITPASGTAASARLVGDKVYLRGGLQATAGIPANSGVWANTGFPPPVKTHFPNAYIAAGSGAHNSYIDTDGKIYVDLNGAGGDVITLGGIVYAIN